MRTEPPAFVTERELREMLANEHASPEDIDKIVTLAKEQGTNVTVGSVIVRIRVEDGT